MNLTEMISTSVAIFFVSVAWIFVCVAEFNHPLTPWIEKPFYYFAGWGGLWLGMMLHGRIWREYQEEQSARLKHLRKRSTRYKR